MRNAGQYTCVVLLLLTQVHCKEDPVNTLINLLDRVDNKPMVKHLHPNDADPVKSLFQLFDRTDQKPMVVVVKEGEKPHTIDFVVDDGTGSDISIRDMFGLSTASDDDVDDSLEKNEKNIEALAQALLSGSNPDEVKHQIGILRQDLIARCGQKQCGKKQCQKCQNNFDDVERCSDEDSDSECGEKTTKCGTTTTKCPKKWFSTGRPSW